MKTKKLSNNALIERCLHNKKGAWAEFWSRHQKIIYYFPQTIFGFTQEDSASFYQFAFKSITDSAILATYDEKQDFPYWLVCTLRELFLDFLIYRGSALVAKNAKKNTEETFSIIQQLRTLNKNALANFPFCSMLIHCSKTIETLSTEERIILKLNLLPHFFFTNNELNLLKQNTHHPHNLLLAQLSALRETIRNNTNNRLLQSEELQLNEYINILHLERQKFLTEKKVASLEEEHNFDFKMIEKMDLVNKTVTKLRNKLLKRSRTQKTALATIATPPEEITTLLAMPLEQVNTLLKKLKKSIQKLEIEAEKLNLNSDYIIRLYAIEEKINLFGRRTKQKCLDIPTLLELANIDPHKSRTEKNAYTQHLAKCTACQGTLQMLHETKVSLLEKKKKNPPKDIIQYTKKAIEQLPAANPILIIKKEKQTASIIKSILLKTAQTEQKNARLDKIQIKIVDHLFSLKIGMDKAKLKITLTNIDKGKKEFHGIFLLSDNKNEVYSPRILKKNVVFSQLADTNYTLAIIKPSTHGVTEQGKINIIVIDSK